jgi:hypothetical protein
VSDVKTIRSSLWACWTPAILRFSRIHQGEVPNPSIAVPGIGYAVDQFVILIHAQDAVGREALDGERPGDADRLSILIGFVIEVLELGLGGDGGVDLLLPGNPLPPPVGVELLAGLRPLCVGIAGNLPLLPGLAEGLVVLRPQRFQRFLEPLPDDVDLGVVGDGFEGDVRHPFVDKALADVAAGRLARLRRVGNLGLFELPLAAVGEEVVGVAGAHDPGTGQGEGDTGGVDGDPAAAPLLGNIGGGAGAAGGVKDKVAGVGRKKQTPFNHSSGCLNDVNFALTPAGNSSILPHVA